MASLQSAAHYLRFHKTDALKFVSQGEVTMPLKMFASEPAAIHREWIAQVIDNNTPQRLQFLDQIYVKDIQTARRSILRVARQKYDRNLGNEQTRAKFEKECAAEEANDLSDIGYGDEALAVSEKAFEDRPQKFVSHVVREEERLMAVAAPVRAA